VSSPLCRALVLAGSLAGCQATTPTPIVCAMGCIADPLPHCVSEGACRDDADCPSGLACRSEMDSSSCDDAGAPCACRWRARQPSRLALIDGFVTHAMSLELTPGRLGVTWSPRAGTQFVACAVFTCNPVVRERVRTGNESDEPVTDETTLWRIANAEACILELHVTDSSRTTLPIEGVPWQPAEPMCPAADRHVRVPDFFAAGCWAYDDSSVVAATELVPIAPADLAAVAPGIPADPGCAREGALCFDPAHGFQGACAQGMCQPRCTTAADCELADARLFDTPPDARHAWDCQPVAASFAGVCVPVAPVAR
jgi:hypothetical protein